MLNLLSSIWEWFTASLTWVWLLVLFVGVFGGLFRKSWSAIAGWDSGWDEGAFHKDHPKSNWIKATSRRFSWLRLGLFYYLLWIGAVILWVNGGFSWLTYFTIATIWLLAAPLRNLWMMATVRKIHRVRSGQPLGVGFWEQVSQYYERGFYLPHDESHEPWFKGRARFLNFFQKFRFLIRILMMWGILGQAIVSIIWPITMAIVPYYQLRKAEEYDPKPWWRISRR